MFQLLDETQMRAMIKRRSGPAERRAEVHVSLGRAELLVARELLNRPHWRAAHRQIRTEHMPQDRGYAFDPSLTTIRRADASMSPVDLDDPRVLAQNGLSASEGNPQFIASHPTSANALSELVSRKGNLADQVPDRPQLPP